MGLLGGGLAPGEFAVAAGAHLAAGHDQLEEPELRGLLPQDETSDLAGAVLGCGGCGNGGGAVVAHVEFRSSHPHLAHRVHALHRRQHRLPAGGRYVLLENVLRRRCLLHFTH